MKPSKGISSLVGALFIILSVTGYLLYPSEPVMARAALSGIFIGVFLLFSTVRYRMPETVSSAVMASSAASLSSVMQGLELKGTGIFVPRTAALRADKVFVPLHSGPLAIKRALLTEDRVFFTQGFTKDYGAFVNAPGAEVLALCEQEAQASFAGVGAQMMCSMVKIVEGIDLVSSVDADYDEEAGTLKVAFSHGTYDGLCRELRAAHPDVCLQACCPVCATILSSFAKAEDRPLQIYESTREAGKVRIRARFLEWGTDADE